MLKYSSLLLFVAVAISLSQVEGSAIRGRQAVSAPYKRARTVVKRDAEDDEISAETQERIVKELLAALLEMTTSSEVERQTLSEKFESALEQKWDSIDEYANHLAKVYEEVTGRDPNEMLGGDDSDEDNNEVETEE